MKFTKIPSDAFQKLQINAGILTTDFTPATGTIGEAGQIGATTGGVNFTATPSFSDFGEDIDNCPKNMKELKRLDSWEAKMTGTFINADTKIAKSLCGAADVGTSDGKVTPRNDLSDADFADIWLVGDYSDKNGEKNGGFIKTMWCGDLACEMKMKEEVGLSSRCMPFEQEHLSDVCPCCGKPAKTMVYWGIAY